jgi:dihydrofolate reductase
MGRTTHQAIGRPLPGRTNIIITHDRSYHSEGAVIAHSLEDALAVARILDDEEIFIFGGGAVYAEALPQVERLYLTIVPGTHQADTFFPEFEGAFSQVVHREEHLDSETPHVFETRER